MTFRDLKSTVNALSAHDLTPTGIDSVRMEAGEVVFESEELRDAREVAAAAEAEADEMHEDLDLARNELRNLRNFLARAEGGSALLRKFDEG